MFSLTMSKQIEVSILGEVSSPANSTTTKGECSLESQSVHSGYSQSTLLPVPSNSSDKLDEVRLAGSELAEVTDTSDSLSAGSGSAVSVIDSMQLDGLDTITTGTVQMTSTPISNCTSSQISCWELIKDCDAWLNQNSWLSNTSQELNDRLVLGQRHSLTKKDQHTQTNNTQLEQLVDGLEQLTKQLRIIVALQDTTPF